jgi:carboxypeptidase T
VIIFPWGYVNNPTPNHNALQATVGKLYYRTGYQAMGPGDSFYGAASGATDDAFYALFGAMSMTWELGIAFHEQCQDFEASLPPLLQSLEYLASIAPQPYMLGQGPDIVEATVTPTLVMKGESVILTVYFANDDVTLQQQQQFVDNVATPPQNVIEIRVYMDHPLGVGNENSPAMWVWNATDIADWSESSEENNNRVGVIVLSMTLSWEDVFVAQGVGNHVWYIQALDNDGYWGPVAAIPITIQEDQVGTLLPESKLPVISFSSSWSSSPSLAPSFPKLPLWMPSSPPVVSIVLSQSPTTRLSEESNDPGTQQQQQRLTKGIETFVLKKKTETTTVVLGSNQW